MKEIIEELLEKNKNNKNISFDSCIIIHGKSGIGKTYKINKICDELNLNVIHFTPSNVNNSNDFEDLLQKKTTVKKNVVDIFNNVNNENKKIIIIHDYDILVSIDRTINSTLYNILNSKKNKNICIVCICNTEILKKIGNIKKKCKIFECEKLNKTEIKKILKNNNKINEIRLDQIVDKIDGNIASGMIMIEHETNKEVDKVIDSEYIYKNNIKIDNIIRFIYTDTWLISLRFHENLINILKNRKSELKKKNLYYKNFISDFCLFDLLINRNLTEQAIDIISYQIFILSNIEIKNKRIKTDNNFTKLLSYLSLQKKNTKKGFNYNSNYYQIGSYHINCININLYS
jgi:DNA polymerase III delta prime subunit